MRRRPVVLMLAGLYALAILLIGLWPTHVDRNLDMAHRPPATWLAAWLDLTSAQAYDIGEFCANVLLFAPLGVFAMLLVARLSLWHTTACAAALSVAIELTQTWLRPDRTGSVGDVIANTAGAAIGAAVIVGVRRAKARSARPPVTATPR